MDNNKEMYPTEIEDLEDYEPAKSRRVYRVIGFLIIAGLIYITGVEQALFFRKTPLGTPQQEAESLLNAETIIVSLNIIVFRNNGNFGSGRTQDDIAQIVSNASDIWNQADIDFQIKQTVFIDVSDDEIRSFFENPRDFVLALNEYDPEAINIFFSKSLVDLPDVTGIAFVGLRAVAVPDLTTVYDFRVLAHEIGHILGLGHSDLDKSSLMYKNANSFDITEEEVLTARDTALKF
ncbi:MAG: hypothetical protein A3C03_00355 [Candidatus Colwellbacteria bacterium RIFCSPHIGHO2_02_FULL_45_17]|uniref:Peptidase M10 metallopeptidase domain-containing protein n=2 Tax=Candidatus Colwelliibacteriota TaxID=1817904 RepID=A0A1G1ZBZ3_9BACT|nr:MAG: hypothetical protein A3C03_00355 [Candidatus Colwellbacteria bacterium RIFCSPHIGHO2_02_FULL_45_17]OGY61569.1 MAG: hypothetical protein A3I33_00410 [Candidatus Colwellbacteria bacterium RIFCSPLOWO2_02_FULL_45_11]OGY62155.1 MAG: hypothetical protein A3G58_02350 [Candidatus Colwellbacteria bacterium RIFCSPLOWO2_12_FULL_46_17]